MLFALCVFGVALPAGASTYVPVGDEVYDLLSRLEAEGVVRSGLLSTKPVSRNEAIRLLREAEGNAEQGSPYIKRLVGELKTRLRPREPGQADIKPIDRVYAGAVYLDRDDQTLNYNNNGDVYEKGWNTRFGFVSRIDDLGRFSFYVHPELRTSRDETDIDYLATYGVFDFGWDLVAGKDSQWWGPGYHGTILLSNNAEPFTMLKINNPEPKTLPWIFKYLGPFGFTFFATNLSEHRADVPEPYLWGIRLSFKPHPSVEVGLSRTAMLGGEGRPDDWGAWWDSISMRGEHGSDEAGDQRAGYDLAVTLPFHAQPVRLYTEGAAEDTVGGRLVQWAYIYGIYLPRILSLERLEVRYEWAETYDRHEPSTWYTHHIYTEGYTYKQRIIGHHMGTNSRDNFLELTYRVPERNARLSIWYDVEEYAISTAVREKRDETGVRVVYSPVPSLDVNVAYAYGLVKNPGNLSLPTVNVSQAEVWVEMRF
jgi:hypothetical protein